MAAAVGLRGDFGAGALRAAARRSKDGPHARRLLALAAIYDGATRTEAAKMGGVGLQVGPRLGAQVQRAWPRRPDRPQSPGAAATAERRALRGAGGDLGEWADPGGSRGRALADRRSLPMDFRGVPHRRLPADAQPSAAQDGLSQALGSPSPSRPGRRRNRGF
jgi:hypothetical protein